MKGMDLASALAAPVQGRGSGQGARSRSEAGNTDAESFDTVFNDVHGVADAAHRQTDDAGAGSAVDGAAQGADYGSAAVQNPAAASGKDGAAFAGSAGQAAGQAAGHVAAALADQPTPLTAALGLPVQDGQAPSAAPGTGQQPPGPTPGLPCRERCWPRPRSRRPSRPQRRGRHRHPVCSPSPPFPSLALLLERPRPSRPPPGECPRRQQHRTGLHHCRGPRPNRRCPSAPPPAPPPASPPAGRKRTRSRRQPRACGPPLSWATLRHRTRPPLRGRRRPTATAAASAVLPTTWPPPAVQPASRPQRSPRASVPAPPAPRSHRLHRARHGIPRTPSPQPEPQRPPRRRPASRRRQPLPRRNPRPQRLPSRAPRSSRSWPSRSSRSPEPRRGSTS